MPCSSAWSSPLSLWGPPWLRPSPTTPRPRKVSAPRLPGEARFRHRRGRSSSRAVSRSALRCRGQCGCRRGCSQHHECSSRRGCRHRCRPRRVGGGFGRRRWRRQGHRRRCRSRRCGCRGRRGRQAASAWVSVAVPEPPPRVLESARLTAAVQLSAPLVPDLAWVVERCRCECLCRPPRPPAGPGCHPPRPPFRHSWGKPGRARRPSSQPRREGYASGFSAAGSRPQGPHARAAPKSSPTALACGIRRRRRLPGTPGTCSHTCTRNPGRGHFALPPRP